MSDPLVLELTLLARKALRKVAPRVRLALEEPDTVKTGDPLEVRVGKASPKKLPALRKKPVALRRPSIAKKLRKSPLYAACPPTLKPVVSPVIEPLDDAERAGPINWSPEDLRIKYRDEHARQRAFEASDLVARHPLWERILATGDHELHDCLGRARVRCSKRRFVLDVHQIWLTNLDHLCGASRHKRCDSAAVDLARSQIQSIAPEYSVLAPVVRPDPPLAWADLHLAPLPSPEEPRLSPPETQRLVAGDAWCFVDKRADVWRFSKYHPATGDERTVTTRDVERVASRDDPMFFVGIQRVHCQAAWIQGRVHVVQVFVRKRPERALDPVVFKVVAVAGTDSVGRFETTSLQVVDVLGLTHAPLCDEAWWMRAAPQFAALCDHLMFWNGKLRLRLADDDDAVADRATALSLLPKFDELQDQGIPFLLDDEPETSLSVASCGHADRRGRLVPGLARVGPQGLRFARDSSVQRCRLLGARGVDATETVVLLTRHAVPAVVRDCYEVPATTSLAATVMLGIDVAFLAPQQTEVDPTNLVAPPGYRSPPSRIPRMRGRHPPETPLTNPVTTRLSATMMALSSMAKGPDHASDGSHRRFWHTMSDRGFRHKTEARLIVPDPHLDARLLGVSRSSMTTASPSMLGRFTRHSDEPCADELCRRRDADDYLVVLRKMRHQGANDPQIFALKRGQLERGSFQAALDAANSAPRKPSVHKKKKQTSAVFEEPPSTLWRRLYRVGSSAASRMLVPHTQGPSPTQESVGTGRVVGVVRPNSVTYVPDEAPPSEVRFIADPVKDLVDRQSSTTSSSEPTRERLVALTQNETTEADLSLVDVDQRAELEAQAILGAKSGDTAKIEDALDRDVAVDLTDHHGNSLLILAAQTNSKKTVKCLLRRGANLNAQNAKGNTALHFCHEYNFESLADYLLSKGADDRLLNGHGRTCYEGLNN